MTREAGRVMWNTPEMPTGYSNSGKQVELLFWRGISLYYRPPPSTPSCAIAIANAAGQKTHSNPAHLPSCPALNSMAPSTIPNAGPLRRRVRCARLQGRTQSGDIPRLYPSHSHLSLPSWIQMSVGHHLETCVFLKPKTPICWPCRVETEEMPCSTRVMTSEPPYSK